MKVAIVGAGVAGTAAALAARARGADVVVIDGPGGASAVASGAWDVTSEAPGPAQLADPRTLADAVRDAVRARPGHPLARFGDDPVARVARAHAALLDALSIYRPLALDRPPPMVATSAGVLRRTATAQHAVLAVDERPAALVGVAMMRGLRAFDGRFVARALAHASDVRGDAYRFAAVEVEYGQRRHDALAHAFEIAALADASDARARLAHVLARAFAPLAPSAVLVPPVLGITDDGAARAVAELSGLALGELAHPGAGAQGLRLRRRLDAALAAARCARVRARAERLVPGSTTRLVLEGGEDLLADAFVLASGTIGGTVLRLSRSRAVDLSPRADENAPPGAERVRFDARSRAIDDEGHVVADDLFVAGDLLDGVDPARDGLGCAATTGWAAGESVSLG